MWFSETIADINGCETRTLVEEDNSTRQHLKPSIFVVVARTQEQLDFAFDNLTDETLKQKMLADQPALKNGLPHDRQAIMVFSRNTQWVAVPVDTRLNPATGVLNLRFLGGYHKQSRGHIVLSDIWKYPLKINAEFLDPFGDCPVPRRRSPHSAAEPGELRLH